MNNLDKWFTRFVPLQSPSPFAWRPLDHGFVESYASGSLNDYPPRLLSSPYKIIFPGTPSLLNEAKFNHGAHIKGFQFQIATNNDHVNVDNHRTSLILSGHSN